MEILSQTLSILGALVILISNIFSPQIYQYFHFQQNSQLLADSTKFYAFFSLLMVGRYLRAKRISINTNRLADEGKLLSTAVYILTSLATLVFLYLMSQDPTKSRNDLLLFTIRFVPICLSLGVATNHAAQIVSKHAKYVSHLFLVLCTLLFLVSILDSVGILGAQLTATRYTKYLLLVATYSLVYLPSFWNKDKAISN